MKSLVRILLLVGFLGLVAAATFYAFMPQPVDVELVSVSSGRLTVTVDEDGKTRVRDRYVVSAPLNGRLLRVELRAGAAVTAGETLLAVLEPHEPDLLDPRTVAQTQAKVAAARAALERLGPTLERVQLEWKHAQGRLARLRDLAQNRAVAADQLEDAQLQAQTREQDYQTAKFARDVAKFELELAEAALLRTTPSAEQPADNRSLPIRAPITGRVLRVLQESATVVTAGTRLLEVGDPEQLEVEVDVLSSDAVRIQAGAKAWLEQWGGDEPLASRVRLVEPSAFTKISALGVEEQRVNAILDFEPGEKPAALADGFRVEAQIVVWEKQDVLQVPTGALFRQGDDWAVFVAEAQHAKLRTIELGQRNSLAAQVLRGLEAGEQVLLHPSDKVRDGVLLKPRPGVAAK